MYTSPPVTRFSFTGRGSELFGILIVNFLFTIITLGLYYPWAKARTLQYYYGHFALDGHPFHFHGTGKEMFKGFIKAVFLIAAFYGVFFGLFWSGHAFAAGLFLFIMLIGLVPLVIHGSLRFRSSRSSWRNIRFGYRGNRMELIALFVRDSILTVVTLGIYGAWFQMNLRKYIIDHLRYGNSSFQYKGDGFEFLILNIKGYLLTLVTFGVYFFWWQRDLMRYMVNNTSWEFQDGRRLHFLSTATAGSIFRLLIGNVVLVLFTFGIGFAWAEVRTMNFLTRHLALAGDADLDAVVQTELSMPSATADEVGDLLDIDIFL
jgi:uncharacterized membrane protein YjgN (DUF898 family)